MLRITTRIEQAAATIQLEGELAGVWVCELSEAWRNTRRALDGQSLSIDLSAVCRVDKAGEYLLALIRSHGTRLIGSGLVAGDLIQGIARDWPAGAATSQEA
jgi:ABC-type transporter Mla MlaB component